MFKYIIFDLDNTLYNYDIPHKIALDIVYNTIKNESNISIDIIQNEYKNINKDVKLNILTTSCCHSRILYFKTLIENLDISHLFSADTLNNIYWDTFYNNIVLNDKIIELLSLFKVNNIKLGIITNFTLEHQYKKLKHLKILHFFDVILSSEDTLFEKPNEYIFLKLKEKCKCVSNEILIIGDSFTNDIEPSLKLGFNCNHLNLKQIQEIVYCDNYISFNNTKSIYTFYDELLNELKKYVHYSKRIGERYDLVQAGGGNISFKYKELLIIKASGICISDTTFNIGYSIINNTKLLNDFINNKRNNLNSYSVFNTNNRPSIETYMHSFLKNIVIHIHPLVFLRTLIKKNYNFDKIIQNYLIIEYCKPGFELAQVIYKNYTNEDIFLLKNHGIIVTGNNFDQVFTTINVITEKLEKNLNILYTKYRFTNTISTVINSSYITYLSEDQIIKENIKSLVKNLTYFPDKVIYCGIKILFINNISELNYNNNEPIIIFDNNLYIISDNLIKCRQIEEMIKAHILVIKDNTDIIELTNKDVSDLLSRDDEKYRQNLYK